MPNLKNKRIVITGGAGFLGQHLQRRLKERGVSAENILIPLIEDYDLTKEADCVRMYEAMQPDIVIHLAAEVGGIGANRDNPGRFFYANMAMGLHLIEQARTGKVRPGRHDLCVPQVHPRSVQRRGPVQRLPRRDQRSLRHRQKGPAGYVAVLSRPVRPQWHLFIAGQSLRSRG
jgi:hypothetical protein